MVGSEPQRTDASGQSATTELSDEDYARKLQAEFDREALQPSAGQIAVIANSTDNKSDANQQVSATVPDKTSEDVMPSPRRPANTLMLQASGVTEDTISSTIPLDESPFTIYDKYGDAGDVAFEAKKKQSFTLRKPKPLTIKAVYQSLVKIAMTQGQGSAEGKQRIVDHYNVLVPALLEVGVCEELLLRCCLTLHVPLRPMLGKLMTDKYPDLVALIPQVRGDNVESFIMEGEVVAVDAATGELKNFQTLTNRARKDVELGSITIQVCLFAFDLMYVNEESLLNRPFRERREILRSLFIEVPQRFTWVKSLDATSQDSDRVLEFFKSAVENKCEGLTPKPLANGKKKGKGKAAEDDEKKKTRRKPVLATYEPDKRLDSWLKVKKDYSSSFDTLDLIPIGGWHGQGRKAKWWSPILLAVRNDETGSFEAVCKCMSGFTDVFYKANREFYDDGEVSGEPKNVRTRRPGFIEYSGPEPDVWFEPQEVWEMGFADITLSPTRAFNKLIDLRSAQKDRDGNLLKRRPSMSLTPEEAIQATQLVVTKLTLLCSYQG
ncbi:unnamed protein product [Parascedosporium putredinis]|uniref:ATP-dependent DNA ligase family profile domain-containing protein n=1 Tax=Parascedosporium putredinis TaxID=1442378 RepID=A0A9P1H155_9PEZI|nr:unnamed protein product [Parascedosporium putredinis]CAI7994808.1 unnamed protein product [Parascedosporium putredinis]